MIRTAISTALVSLSSLTLTVLLTAAATSMSTASAFSALPAIA